MKKLLFSVLFVILFSVPALAGDCTEKFSWLPSVETVNSHAVTGYRIYYGPEIVDEATGKYPKNQDQFLPEIVNGRMSGEVEGLDCGEVTHFVVVAYTASGIRSKYSNRTSVHYTPDMPAAPNGFRVEVKVNVTVEVNGVTQ